MGNKKGEGGEIKDAILQYCYKRENEDAWKKCEPENINIKCENCKTSDSKSYFDDLKNWIIKGKMNIYPVMKRIFRLKIQNARSFLKKYLYRGLYRNYTRRTKLDIKTFD